MLDVKRSHEEFRGRLKPAPVIKLYDYWLSKSQDGRLPSRSQIDPVDVPDLLSMIFLVDVLPAQDRPEFRFRLIGSRITEIVGADPTGRRFEEFYGADHIAEMNRIYGEVVSSRQPFTNHTNAPFPKKDYIRFTRLLLPLSENGERVDMILGFLYFENV